MLKEHIIDADLRRESFHSNNSSANRAAFFGKTDKEMLQKSCLLPWVQHLTYGII